MIFQSDSVIVGNPKNQVSVTEAAPYIILKTAIGIKNLV